MAKKGTCLASCRGELRAGSSGWLHINSEALDFLLFGERNSGKELLPHSGVLPPQSPPSPYKKGHCKATSFYSNSPSNFPIPLNLIPHILTMPQVHLFRPHPHRQIQSHLRILHKHQVRLIHFSHLPYFPYN